MERDRPAFFAKPYLFEVARYLYRSYLDEKDVAPGVRADRFVFWVRELHPPLDAGDRSRFGQIVMPQLGVSVQVKQADYAIPELGVEVRSGGYKVIHVSRVEPGEGGPGGDPGEGFEVVETTYRAMKDYLFQTRSRVRPPDAVLLERMRAVSRAALHDQMGPIDPADLLKSDADPQVVHLAPISPVANVAWVYWEAGRMLIRFSADIDLTEPSVWTHQALHTELFDLDDQVVVTLDEVAGSNAYLTRDEVGRVLFNCLVLGKRVVLPPVEAPEAAVGP